MVRDLHVLSSKGSSTSQFQLPSFLGFMIPLVTSIFLESDWNMVFVSHAVTTKSGFSNEHLFHIFQTQIFDCFVSIHFETLIEHNFVYTNQIYAYNISF